MENINGFGENLKQNVAKIVVIGVGGGGGNTIKTIVDEKYDNVSYHAINTDAQALKKLGGIIPLQLETFDENGNPFNTGLGAGARPKIARQAAGHKKNKTKIVDIVKGADLVIIAAGMGGGTGTGASPVIAQIAKKEGALVLAVVTTPFSFEGTLRRKNSDSGLKRLEKEVDSIIVISNNKLQKTYGAINLKDSFKHADTIIKSTIKGLVNIIVGQQDINVDYADLETVMTNKGKSIIGVAEASGEDKAVKVVESALGSPLLDYSIKGSENMVILIEGADVTLDEVQVIMDRIRLESGKEDSNIILGMDSKVENDTKSIKLTIIATGVNQKVDNTEKFKQNLIKEDKKSENVEQLFDKTKEQTVEAKVEVKEEPFDENELPVFLRR